jgi:hypothetical protein
MSHSQFHSTNLFILRHAWLNLWDKHMTTGRINQVTTPSRKPCFRLRRYSGKDPFPSMRVSFRVYGPDKDLRWQNCLEQLKSMGHLSNHLVHRVSHISEPAAPCLETEIMDLRWRLPATWLSKSLTDWQAELRRIFHWMMGIQKPSFLSAIHPHPSITWQVHIT